MKAEPCKYCGFVAPRMSDEDCSANPANHPADELLASYNGTGGRREWWSGGTWLYPGDEVIIRRKQ